jgi:hypothetical protein
MSAAIYVNFSGSVVFISTYTIYGLPPTSWKVAASTPDGAIEIYHWHIPSGRKIVLGLTDPLRELSTRNNS